MKKYIVFDMDGTITNLGHRLHFIEDKNNQDWENFFQSCDKDSLNEWALKLAQSLCGSYEIIIVSGRPERTRTKSEMWLHKHNFPYKHLELVRDDKNHAPDDTLKENWLKDAGIKDEILFVVDDRQRVVDMWRENGLVCLQCYSWKELENPYPKKANK